MTILSMKRWTTCKPLAATKSAKKRLIGMDEDEQPTETMATITSEAARYARLRMATKLHIDTSKKDQKTISDFPWLKLFFRTVLQLNMFVFTNRSVL